MESQLRNVKSIAEAMIHLTTPLIPPSSKSARIDIPALNLSSPPHLRPRFDDLELGPETILEVTKAFENAAATARKLCVAKFEETCHQLLATSSSSECSPLPNLLDKFGRIFQELYERNLRCWSNEVIPSFLKRVTPTPSHTDSTANTTLPAKKFNYEYVPFLEKYFQLSPFPSQADKAFLAKKSGMAYRQIDVWFQNRRSRAKRDGKILKKLQSHEERRISSELLEKLMCDKIIPENDCARSVDSDVSEYEWQFDSDDENVPVGAPKCPRNPNLRDVLNGTSPPHAFPSTYPPSCEYNPFPTKEGKYTFPPPVWMRRPARSIERRTMINVDELIEDFAKMKVRDSPRRCLVKKDSRRPKDPKRTRTPLPLPDCSFITRLLPAPIPALIRPTTPIHITLPVTCPPSSSSPIDTRTGPTLQPRHSTPLSPDPSPSLPEKSSRRRKIASLPRRTPAGTPFVRREGVPAPPEIRVSSPAMPSSNTSISRKSSFASDCSGASSDSSSASSVVLTPKSSPISLPEHLSLSPIHHLSDPSSGRLSPVQGIRLDFLSADGFHMACEKQRFDFTFSAHPHDFGKLSTVRC